MKTNDKSNWERRLAGEVIPIHDGEPDYGFYRVKSRDKTTWRAAAYWYVDGELHCRLDGRDLSAEQACELWPWASQGPISHDLYTAVALRGEPWPDLNAEVTRSNQAPPDNSYEALQERIDDMCREADRLIAKGAAKTQDEADQAADVANKIAELQKSADKEREREKAPHLAKCREVDDRWRPVIAVADIYTRLKQVVCAPFLAAKKAVKDKAEADARKVADDALKAAEDAKRVASQAGASYEATLRAKASVEKLTLEAAAASQKADAIATTPVTAGTRGRSVGLRGKTVVVIEDRAQVLAYFNDRQEITDVLQSLSEKAVKAGFTVPGVKTGKEDRAA